MASTNNNLNGDSGIQNGQRAVDDEQLPHNGNESTVNVNMENVIKLKESPGCVNIGYGRYTNILMLAINS